MKPATAPDTIERVNLSLRDRATLCGVARVYEGGIETDAYPDPASATACADRLVRAYNAYPKLVALVQRLIHPAADDTDVDDARALLRELGE